MELFKQLLPHMVGGSLAALVAAVGLSAAPGDILYVLRRPALLAKAVLSVNVIVPAASIALVWLFPLAPMVKAGIILMAASPVPPLVPAKQLKAGGSQSYAYGLYFSLVILSVLIVPAAVTALGLIYGREAAVPVPALARSILIGVIGPLALGLAVRAFAPALAARIAPTIRLIAMILLVAFVAPAIVTLWPAMMSLVGNGTVVAMALVSATGLLCGHILGGPEADNRPALAIASAVRHPGTAMMIAGANFDDKAVTAAIILFLVTQILVTLPYQIWQGRKSHGTP